MAVLQSTAPSKNMRETREKSANVMNLWGNRVECEKKKSRLWYPWSVCSEELPLLVFRSLMPPFKFVETSICIDQLSTILKLINNS